MPKPFDLKQALAGKPVLEPDGVVAQKVLYVPERGDRPRVLVIGKDGAFGWYHDDGTSFYGDKCLTMADPPKRRVEWWINVYRSGGGGYSTSNLHESKEKADKARQPFLVAVVPVSFEVEDEA